MTILNTQIDIPELNTDDIAFMSYLGWLAALSFVIVDFVPYMNFS